MLSAMPWLSAELALSSLEACEYVFANAVEHAVEHYFGTQEKGGRDGVCPEGNCPPDTPPPASSSSSSNCVSSSVIINDNTGRDNNSICSSTAAVSELNAKTITTTTTVSEAHSKPNNKTTAKTAKMPAGISKKVSFLCAFRKHIRTCWYISCFCSLFTLPFTFTAITTIALYFSPFCIANCRHLSVFFLLCLHCVLACILSGEENVEERKTQEYFIL